MNCNGPDCFYRVTRVVTPAKPQWRRLGEFIPDHRPRVETYTEDIPVRDLWKAFTDAVDLLRFLGREKDLPKHIREVYFGKDQAG